MAYALFRKRLGRTETPIRRDRSGGTARETHRCHARVLGIKVGAFDRATSDSHILTGSRLAACISAALLSAFDIVRARIRQVYFLFGTENLGGTIVSKEPQNTRVMTTRLPPLRRRDRGLSDCHSVSVCEQSECLR